MVNRERMIAAVGTFLAGVWLWSVPLHVVEGFAPLVGYGLLAAGATITVGRTRAVDLSLAGIAALGAYGGGVTVAELAVPPVLGIPVAVVVGALAGAAVGAILGRAGRLGGALATLAIGTAIVALLPHWPSGGGVAGYHAVPFLTGDARGDLALLSAGLVGALWITTRWARSRTAATAATAAASPTVAAALGASPPTALAATGVVGGAIVGLGGLGLATATGSATPAAFGLPLAALIALVGLLGGAPPWGPLLATLVVWAPGAIWTSTPTEVNAVIAGGLLGMAVLALRRGAPLRPWSRPRPEPWRARADGTPRRRGPATLTVEGAPLPGGGSLSFEVDPGEVVAVVGPNGSGKSTLLARIAGQLPDDGTIRLRGARAPRGARRRAQAGIARTWQQGFDIPPADVERTAISEPEDRQAFADGAALAGRGGAPWLRCLLARRPAVALLDEPGATESTAVIAAVVRHLARLGTAVVVAEHRPEVIALADRVVRIGDERG